jgi:hypothetical protein
MTLLVWEFTHCRTIASDELSFVSSIIHYVLAKGGGSNTLIKGMGSFERFPISSITPESMYFVNKLHVLFNKVLHSVVDGCCLHCETYKLSWRTPPKKKKKNKIFIKLQIWLLFFFSKNREDGTCHKASYCGRDHRTNHFLWKGGHPPLPSPPLPSPCSPPQNLFLSPGLNIAAQSKSAACPANLRISPKKEKKFKKKIVLSLLSQIVTCSTHSKEKENVDK